MGVAASAPDARALAAELTHDVLDRRLPLDVALERRLGRTDLTPRDIAFARRIAATTLRRLGQIDAVVAHCVERPLPERASRARDILRTGIAQLLFLDTPAHAAVDRTVSLFRGRALAPYRGLANAVLRRIARDGTTLVSQQDAARLNTPDWLWQAWAAAYGDETCRRIAEGHLAEPPLDITPREEADIWARRLDARVLPTGSLRRTGGGAVTELPGFAAGGWWVQDAAAALPAKLLLAALGDGTSRRVADLCAAPGGKTAQLAAAGAAVTALDRSPARLALLRTNLERLGLSAETVEAEVETWHPARPFEAVLLDAPCTATGTARRHPDIPWLKSANDVAAMSEVQARLLAAAAGLVAPGGVLVYSVCSLQPEEGPMRTARFLADNERFSRLPVSPEEIGGLAEAITDDGDLMTLPCHLADQGGIDGFYAARLRHREDASNDFE